MQQRSITLSRSTSPNPTLTNQLSLRRPFRSALVDLLRDDVDTTRVASQMNAYYLMSGYMNAVSFSAIFVWCGFQSGNTVQLAIAMARLWEGETTKFLIADKQALASLLTFVLGSLLARLGENILEPRSRGWLWLATVCQSLFTMAAAISVWKSGQGYPGISDDRFEIGPAWDDAMSFLALIFMSISMGMQGLVSIRLKTNSGATLPLTTTWVELMGVEGLFKRNSDTARDQRLIGIVSVMLGALAGRGITFRLGSPGALGVAAGIRMLIAFSWLLVPTDATSKEIAVEEKDGQGESRLAPEEVV